MAIDFFGEKTEFPEIRARIVAQLNVAPAEPFSEFLLYTLGRFGDAVKFNPRSPIHTVLAYASVHSTLRKVMSNVFEQIAKPGDREFLLGKIDNYSYRNDSYEEIPYKEETTEETNTKLANRDFFNDHAYERIANYRDDYNDNEPSLTQYLNYFNKFPERYNSGPIVLKIANFASLTDALLPQFEEVLRDRRSPHFDDAAYFLGWLAYHRGNIDDALNKFQVAMALLPRGVLDDSVPYVRRLDYPYLALHQASRIFRTLSPEDAIDHVKNSEILSSDSMIWQTVLTSLYNSHQYRSVMNGAHQALGKFGIRIEDLPVTTDPERIAAIFTKLKLAEDYSLQEIVYLYNSSREIGKVEELLSDLDRQSASSVDKEIRSVIIKYSLTNDSDLEGTLLLHKDLRQSLFVAQRSLDLLPKTAGYLKLRQWIHYKRLRLLAQFDPIMVAAANAEFRNEFPESALLDDGMAEQIFAEAVTVGDMVKAEATFDSLRQQYPDSNAVDNAYSWLAIGWTCAGQPIKAREIDQRIVRLFPLTRHARYARERIENPAACSSLLQLYNWDYQAMRWRERNRIDTLQAAIKAGDVTSTPSKSNARIANPEPQISSRKFKTYTNTDLFGLLVEKSAADSVAACEALCNANADCEAFTFNVWNAACFLKKDVTLSLLEPSSVSGVGGTGTMPLRSSAAKSMFRYRGKAFPGTPFGTDQDDDFDACEQRCKANDDCVAFSYVAAESSCSMFSEAGEYSPKPGVDSGVKRQLE